MEDMYGNDYRRNLEKYWQQYYPSWSIPDGYHVHHIKPKCTFEDQDDPRIHHPRNLIALHPDDHVAIHRCRGDKLVPESLILAISGRINWNKGLPTEDQPFFGQHHTKEHKLTVSKRQTGKGNSFYNKRHSSKTKQLMSKQGKGRKWYNNGVKSGKFFPGTEPDGFILGRYP